MNALDYETTSQMLEKLRAWNKNPESQPKAMLISGVGDFAFSAGGDLVNLYRSLKAGVEISKLL